MALSKGGIITAGLLSTGGIGGSIALGYHLTGTNKAETFRDKLTGTLLTNEQADDAKWDSRVTLLSQADVSQLTPELKTIKEGTGNNKKQEIKDWCNKILNSNYSENEQLLTDLRKYCSYNIKEKLTRPIDTNSWSADTHDKKLKDMSDDKLSPKMKSIKDQLNDTQNRTPNALKDWCISLKDLVFKGTDDSEFKDAQKYCATK